MPLKGIRKVIRTLSGDGLSKSPSRGKRGRRKGGADSSRVHEAQLFCNDMYTVEYVLESLDQVAQNDEICNVVLEDLIERNNPKITQAVQDMFVQTTMSAKLLIKKEIQQQVQAKSGSSSSSSDMFGNMTLRGGSTPGSKNKKSKCKRRVWKKIAFVDCISDGQSYKVYLSRKGDFVSALTRFLRLQGFQNDLPVAFEAKIEIHNLLDGPTILELLHSIQRDTTVTRVEFGGALGHTQRHVPEEFGKLLNPETGTVKETIVIRLHYDKQSLNMEHEDRQEDDNPQSSSGAGNGLRPGAARRQSQLDVSVLSMIRRMALVLEQKLMPNDLSSDFVEMSELSDFDRDSSKQSDDIQPFKELPRTSSLDKRKPSVKLDLFGNPMDDFSEMMESRASQPSVTPFGNSLDPLGKSGRSEGSEDVLGRSTSSGGRRRARPKASADGGKKPGTIKRSITMEGDRPRGNKPPMIKRNLTMDGDKPRSPGKSPRRAISVDEGFWEQTEQQLERNQPTESASRKKKSSPSPSRKSSKSPSPSRKSNTPYFPDSAHRRGDSPNRKEDKMTSKEKQALLNSVNSVSSPIVTEKNGVMGEKAAKSLLDTSSGVNGQSRTKTKPVGDDSASMKAYCSDSDCSSHGGKKKKKSKRKNNDIGPLQLRRTSSDVPTAAKEMLKQPNMVRAKSDDGGGRQRIKKAHSFHGESRPEMSPQADFDWEHFSPTSAKKDPSGKKAKSRSIMTH